MADVVQYRLERMVAELDDLERRGLFSRREIAEIVKMRRKFEYRLKRPSPLKQDFLAYIDYEKKLDALRILRKKSVSREMKAKGNKKMKKSLSDFAGVRRIVEIYRMATSRFKGDLDLWFQFLEFCRERKHGRMKKAMVQAIRFHPKVPGLWIYAAAWEFDHNLNAAAARALMQSGLRACPNSEDLWVEYLRMELTYLNKLITRKAILGEDVGALVRDDNEKKWREENKDLFMSLEEQKEGDNDLNAEKGESNEKLNLFREQGFSILCTVYKGAIEALPTSLNLRKRFLEILEAIDLAHSEEMQDEIIADMKRDFWRDPEYWDWLARREINDLGFMMDISAEDMHSKVGKAVQIYEEALQVIPTAAMCDLYVKFLMHLIVAKGGETQMILNTSDHATEYVSRLLKVFERAETMGCLTHDLAYEHISLYLQIGSVDEARKLAEKFCCGGFSDAVKLWILRVSIELKYITRKSRSPSEADLLSIFGLLTKVLTKATVSDAKNLWLMAMKFFANSRNYFNKLLEISVVSLARDGGSENEFSLSSAIVNFILQKDGIQRARDLYNRFIVLPRPGLALYKHCIELETNLASAGDNEGLVNARKLFESALATYKQDIGLWQGYHAMEKKMGTSETVNAVYWRAQKAHRDAVTLIAPSKR
ncbi:hypothetical protein Nepgr_021291 [Nepenthes gracilis]|uniref:U3 small nucleolar RNA-associated protein 6 homolog n=1 Tax=Nepenthes gracilis TaxID=150966 RepID=A0AAD3SYD5_NEPGR|nr:hypothetical protein Nepgr_021291 [Nepenthes gracilis]